MPIRWLVFAVLFFLSAPSLIAVHAANPDGQLRTYYIAADEVEWNYAPAGIDQMTGLAFEGIAKAYTERGPQRIGTVYRKAVYREYTDETFTKLKPRPPQQEHMGLLGPLIRAEVGDTIKIVFKNNASRPYSMHPHGVFYEKNSEGALYNDGTSGPDKADDAVLPKRTHVYSWQVPERAGPGIADPSSVVWLYHSHVDEPTDIMSGLVGVIVISRKGMARADASPRDVDREFICFFNVFDENRSWYLDRNIQTYTLSPKDVKRAERISEDATGKPLFVGIGFDDVNFKGTINGFMYGNGPMMTMKKGEHVRWYLVALGDFFNIHTPHWHGNNVTVDGKHTDVVLLGPAQMLVADMVPDNPGMWMLHCHVDEHMVMGMHTHYMVMP